MTTTPQWALRKIEHARSQQASRLDLWNPREKLTHFPPEILELTHLTVLDLQDHQLQVIPDQLASLPLGFLDLRGNPLQQVGQQTGLILTWSEWEVMKLETDQVAGLQLEDKRHLKQVSKRFPKLKWLSLQGLELKKVPEHLSRLANLTVLYLSDNQLKEIPEHLSRLANLTELNLSRNQLKEIPEHLTRLANLTVLHLSYNQLKEIPEHLTRLANLAVLNLSRNQLKEIPEHLTRLANLTVLNLSRNQLKEIPEHLSRLANLTLLNLSDNQLKEIPEHLSRLVNLTVLHLWNNQLKEIPEHLSRLANLTVFDLTSNQLKEIPEHLTCLPKLQILKVGNNPLQQPPKEIAERGLEAMRRYYAQQQEQGSAKMQEARLLIVGEAGAGKTSLMEKLLNENYPIPNKEPSTTGIQVRHYRFLIDGEEFEAHLWDFGGQEIQYATHQFFLSPRALYVLLCDDRRQHTVFDYWFNSIELLGEGSPVLVVLNERDGVRITNYDHRLWRETYAGTLTIEKVEVDLAEKSHNRYHYLKETIQNQLSSLPHVGQPLPAKWKPIRAELSERTDENHISLDDYFQICRKHKLTDEQDQLQLLDYLHDLGMLLHYKDPPSLSNQVFLNPRWVLDAVYAVLVCESVAKNNGHFQKDWLYELWKNLGYGHTERNNLLELMLRDRFEMCFQLPGEQGYLTPQLLPTTRPDQAWVKPELAFRYNFAYMPKGIMARLIVRHHAYLDVKSAWRHGAVFQQNRARALVQERVTHSKGERVLEILVSGEAGASKQLLEEMRAEVRVILERSFPKVRVTEEVPLAQDLEIAIPYEFLLKQRQKGKATVAWPGVDEELSISKLLEGLEEKSNNREPHPTVNVEVNPTIEVKPRIEVKPTIEQKPKNYNKMDARKKTINPSGLKKLWGLIKKWIGMG